MNTLIPALAIGCPIIGGIFYWLKTLPHIIYQAQPPPTFDVTYSPLNPNEPMVVDLANS